MYARWVDSEGIRRRDKPEIGGELGQYRPEKIRGKFEVIGTTGRASSRS